MKIDAFKGKSISVIEEELKTKNHLLALSGEDDGIEIFKITQQHGTRAGALLTAVMLFIREHTLVETMYEVSDLLREISEKIDQRDPVKADKFRNFTHGIEEGLCWDTSCFHQYEPLYKRREEWSLYPSNTNLDEKGSMAAFLGMLSVKAFTSVPTDKQPISNLELIALTIASRTIVGFLAFWSALKPEKVKQ